MSDFVLSQVLIGVVFVIDLASFQFRNRRHVLACLSTAAFLIGVHFVLLETWTAFSELVSCGKVKTVGVSNYSAARLKELVGLIDKHSLAPLGAVQMKYTVIDRVRPSEPALYAIFDTDTKAMLHEVSPETMVFAYSPLVSGQVFEKPPDAQWPHIQVSCMIIKAIINIRLV